MCGDKTQSSEGGTGEAHLGSRTTTHTRRPKDTNQRSVATDGTIHTVWTHETTRATAQANTMRSEVRNAACGQGPRAGVNISVFSWQGLAEA